MRIQVTAGNSGFVLVRFIFNKQNTHRFRFREDGVTGLVVAGFFSLLWGSARFVTYSSDQPIPWP